MFCRGWAISYIYDISIPALLIVVMLVRETGAVNVAGL